MSQAPRGSQQAWVLALGVQHQSVDIGQVLCGPRRSRERALGSQTQDGNPGIGNWFDLSSSLGKVAAVIALCLYNSMIFVVTAAV